MTEKGFFLMSETLVYKLYLCRNERNLALHSKWGAKCKKQVKMGCSYNIKVGVKSGVWEKS